MSGEVIDRAIAIAIARQMTTTTSLRTEIPSTRSLRRPLDLVSESTAREIAGEVPTASAEKMIARPIVAGEESTPRK